MKKVLVFMFMWAMLVPTLSYAQEGPPQDSAAIVEAYQKLQEKGKQAEETIDQYVTDSDVEKIVDKYGGKIVDGFNNFVDAATPVAKEGFTLVVKLQIAKGVFWLFLVLVTIVVSIMATKEYKRLQTILRSDNIPDHMDKRRGPWDEDNASFTLIITTISAVVLFVVSLVFAYSGITHLIAPEWYAIVELVDLLKESTGK